MTDRAKKRPWYLLPAGSAQHGVALAMVDQAILSAFNFCLQIALIRLWSPDQFGVFALLANALLILANFQNGLFTTQYSILVPQAREAGERQLLRTSIFSANFAFCVLAALAIATGVLFIGDRLDPVTLACAAFYLCASLLREYTRVVMISDGKVSAALKTDIIGTLLILPVGALLYLASGKVELWHILLALGTGAATSVTIEVALNRSVYAMSFARHSRQSYARVFREHATWILVGILATETQTRSLFFFIGAWYGPAAVGLVQAGLTIYRPIGVLWLAWSRVMRPMFARAYAEGKDELAARMSHYSAAGFLIATLGMMVVGALVWPALEQYVFAGRYPGVGLAVALWGLSMTLTFVRGTYAVRMQGQGRFRELAYISLAAAPVTLLLVAALTVFNSASYTILANFVGEVLMLIAVLWLLEARNAPRNMPAPAE
jgi:O-antigen/teichoic acid export membrane protein